MRHLTLLVLLACLAPLAAGDAPTPVHELELDVGLLDTWGTRTFVYRMVNGDEVADLGTVTMRTTVGDDAITLEDGWNLTWRGKEMAWAVKARCGKAAVLPLKEVSSTGAGDDEVKSFAGTVADGKLAVTVEGRQREVDLPDGTVVDIAVFRLFTLLPREEGFTTAVGHSLELSELNLKQDGTLSYAGMEEIILHDQAVQLHKFIFARDGRTVEEAWVDQDGVLRQVRIDGRKVLTETEPPSL